MYTLERILPTFKCTFMSAAITFRLVNEFIFTKEDQSTENIKDYHRSDCAMILLMDSCKKTTPNQMAFIGGHPMCMYPLHPVNNIQWPIL